VRYKTAAQYLTLHGPPDDWGLRAEGRVSSSLDHRGKHQVVCTACGRVSVDDCLFISQRSNTDQHFTRLSSSTGLGSSHHWCYDDLPQVPHMQSAIGSRVCERCCAAASAQTSSPGTSTSMRAACRRPAQQQQRLCSARLGCTAAMRLEADAPQAVETEQEVRADLAPHVRCPLVCGP
jgi:hypothetical protein